MFPKIGQSQGQGHYVKYISINRKVLSQGIDVCNIKALSLLVQKLWSRLSFFKSRSKVKVKVMRQKNLVPTGRYCHKKYTCEIWKPLSLLVQKLWPRLSFFKSRSKVKVKVTKSKLLVSIERPCHKEYTCVILKPYHFWFKSYGQG